MRAPSPFWKRIPASRRITDLSVAFRRQALIQRSSEFLVTRRSFLVSAGRLSAAAMLVGLHPPSTFAEKIAGEQSSSLPPVSGKERLIIRTAAPLNLETPASFLTTYITPNDLHFVRNHYNVPELDAGTWRLTIDGEVDRPLTLTLDDVKGFDRITVVRTLECAGNGRSFFNPKTPGAQWGGGAVGTARYEGVRLGDVL